MSGWIIEVGDTDFESAVVERSAKTPVVVDFWAPWCGPCRALGPLLERLTEEHQGAFVLAKVNVDEAPGLSAALNIRSIPMVLGFRDRQVVAEFVGALPESGVREFLSKVLPSEADRLAVEGDEEYAAGRLAEAEANYRRALALDARGGRALVGLARLHAARGEDAAALELLERVLTGPLQQEAERLAAEIRVRQGGDGDERALRERLTADPADLPARLALAQILARAKNYSEALTHYLEIVRRDRTFRDGVARKAMLDIFELLGPRHETTEHFRSELAKVLFS
jgi:putative thioredoxin